MTCIKTGFQAYSIEYDEYYFGDAFKAGDAYIFRIQQRSPRLIRPSLHFNIITIDHWFDRDKEYSTLIATNVTDYGYEGLQIL